MLSKDRFYGGHHITFVMKDDTARRINERNLHGGSLQLANKFRWDCTIDELFYQLCNNFEFIRRILVCFCDGDGTYSLELKYPAIIGWSGTDERSKYKDDDLEVHCPNVRSTVMRVKLDRRDLRAPTTDTMTVVYHIKRKLDHLLVTILSLYPGPDIGPLDGNLTENRGVVMFDFNHPGQTLLP